MLSEAKQDKVRVRLSSLGLTNICQWDVLVFLHHHRYALVTPELISRLIGYRAALITTSLDQLESFGLVGRSRLSQGARLYQLLEINGTRGRAFKQLIALADSRTGRLTIVNELGRGPKAIAAAAKHQSRTKLQAKLQALKRAS